jgi:hypothetical protein
MVGCDCSTPIGPADRSLTPGNSAVKGIGSRESLLLHRMTSVDLEARIAALPCWRGKVKREPLHGGLSNTAFVVDDVSERHVARCGSDIPAHHVFRDRAKPR